jgi:hypothetical protein
MAGQRESVTKRGPPFLALVAAAAVVTAVWGLMLHFDVLAPRADRVLGLGDSPFRLR